MSSSEIHPPLVDVHVQGGRALAKWLVVPGLLLLATLAMPWDLSIAQSLQGVKKWGELGKLVDLSECFSHGLAVGVLLLMIAVLDPLGRYRVARLAAGAYGGGMLANVVKGLVISRQRPAAALEINASSSLATFGDWLPLFLLPREAWRSPWQSFPSAHTATAWGFAVALGHVYPRGRWVFIGFACLASLQRMKSQSHFLSDVLVGAAVGCLAGLLVTQWPVLSRRFSKLESRGITG